MTLRRLPAQPAQWGQCPRSTMGGAALTVWLIRAVAWSALVATLWFAGPRAWRVIEAQFGGSEPPGVLVPLDELSIGTAPDWLRGPLFRAWLTDLQPRLGEPIRLMDEPQARALRDRLAASPWLARVQIERVFPDRFRVISEIRRPRICVVENGRVTALVDAAGVALPPAGVATGLPVVDVSYRAGATPKVNFGALHPDRRARVAAAVAVEWEDEVMPRVAAAPRLLAIDADNLDFGYIADPRYSQVLVGLERVDGGTVWLHHGLATADGGPVEVGVRVEVLEHLLSAAPGLAGIRFADLRRRNLWRDAVRPPLP